MNPAARKTEWIVLGGLALIIVAVCGAFGWSKLTGHSIPLPVIGQLSDFNLMDQDGRPVTLTDLSGKVWIADVIFTRCPGPCARMTRHLAELQGALPTNQPVRLVTLTSDPDYDTPPILKRYANNFGADPKLWTFLTGPKQAIRRIEVNDFKFVVVDKAPDQRTIPDDLFIHSTWFVLVDQRGGIRGWMDAQGGVHAYYDSEDANDRQRLLASVSQLLAEDFKP
jgi:protein SCO1/2